MVEQFQGNYLKFIVYHSTCNLSQNFFFTCTIYWRGFYISFAILQDFEMTV